MVTVKVKTIWNGMVAVRDKYIDKALENKEGITIKNDGDVMTIPFNEIPSKITGRSESPVKDRYSRDSHFLIYFDWKPDTTKQLSFCNVSNSRQR